MQPLGLGIQHITPGRRRGRVHCSPMSGRTPRQHASWYSRPDESTYPSQPALLTDVGQDAQAALKQARPTGQDRSAGTMGEGSSGTLLCLGPDLRLQCGADHIQDAALVDLRPRHTHPWHG